MYCYMYIFLIVGLFSLALAANKNLCYTYLEPNKNLCYMCLEPNKKPMLHIFIAQQTAYVRPKMVILAIFIRNNTNKSKIAKIVVLYVPCLNIFQKEKKNTCHGTF